MPADWDRFRQDLSNRRAELIKLMQMAQSSRSAVILDQSSVGRLSRMDAIQAQEMALAAQRQRDLELRRIDAALNRIETGDYGACVTCGEDIAEKRLLIDPSTPTCINCASQDQR